MLKEWEKKFYPIEANKTKKKDAVNHSLTKWLGARINNLEKYDMCLEGFGEIEDTEGNKFYFNGNTCALCYHYRPASGYCEKCPLYKIRKMECFNFNSCEENSPYNEFCDSCNPEPMITLLRKAKKIENQKINKHKILNKEKK